MKRGEWSERFKERERGYGKERRESEVLRERERTERDDRERERDCRGVERRAGETV